MKRAGGWVWWERHGFWKSKGCWSHKQVIDACWSQMIKGKSPDVMYLEKRFWWNVRRSFKLITVLGWKVVGQLVSEKTKGDESLLSRKNSSPKIAFELVKRFNRPKYSPLILPNQQLLHLINQSIPNLHEVNKSISRHKRSTALSDTFLAKEKLKSPVSSSISSAVFLCRQPERETS